MCCRWDRCVGQPAEVYPTSGRNANEVWDGAVSASVRGSARLRPGGAVPYPLVHDVPHLPCGFPSAQETATTARALGTRCRRPESTPPGPEGRESGSRAGRAWHTEALTCLSAGGFTFRRAARRTGRLGANPCGHLPRDQRATTGARRPERTSRRKKWEPDCLNNGEVLVVRNLIQTIGLSQVARSQKLTPVCRSSVRTERVRSQSAARIVGYSIAL